MGHAKTHLAGRLFALALLLLGTVATVWSLSRPPAPEGSAADFSRRRDGGEESEEDWALSFLAPERSPRR